jgi:hypothetical protein
MERLIFGCNFFLWKMSLVCPSFCIAKIMFPPFKLRSLSSVDMNQSLFLVYLFTHIFTFTLKLRINVSQNDDKYKMDKKGSSKRNGRCMFGSR